MSSARKMKHTARKSMHSVLENRLHVIENIELLQDSTIVRNVDVKEIIRQQRLQQTQLQTKKKVSQVSPLLGRGTKIKEPSTPSGKLHPAVASLKRTQEKETPEDRKEEGDTMKPASGGLLQCIGMGGASKEKASNIPIRESLSAKKGPILKKKQAIPKPKKRQRLSVGSKSPSDLSIKKSKSDESQKPPESSNINEATAERKDPHNDSSVSDIFRKTPPKKEKINIVSPTQTDRKKQASQKTTGRVKIIRSSEYIERLEKKVDATCTKTNEKSAETGNRPAGKSAVSVVSLGSQVSFVRTSTPASLMDSGLTQFGASLSIIRSVTPSSPPKTEGNDLDKGAPSKPNAKPEVNIKPDKAPDPPKKPHDSSSKQKQPKKDMPSSSLERHKRSYSDSDVTQESEIKKALQMKHGATGRKSLKMDRRSSKGTPHKIRNKLSALKFSSTFETSSEGPSAEIQSAEPAVTSKKHKSTSQKKQHSTEMEEKLSEKIKRKATDMLHAVTGRTPQKTNKRKSTEVISELEVKRSPPPGIADKSEVADCCIKSSPCVQQHRNETSPLKQSSDANNNVQNPTPKRLPLGLTETEILDDDAPSPIIPVLSQTGNLKTTPKNLFKPPPEPMKSSMKATAPSVKSQNDPGFTHSPQRVARSQQNQSESDVVMSYNTSEIEPELQFDYPRKSHPVFPGIKPIVEIRQDEDAIADSEDTGDEVVDGAPRLILKLKKTSRNVYALSWQEKDKNAPSSTPKSTPNVEPSQSKNPSNPVVALTPITDSKPANPNPMETDDGKPSAEKRKQTNSRQTSPDPEVNSNGSDTEDYDAPVFDLRNKSAKSGTTAQSEPWDVKSDLVQANAKSGSVISNPETLETLGSKGEKTKPAQGSQGTEKVENIQAKSDGRNIFEMLSDCQKPVEEKKVNVQVVPHGCIQDGLILKIRPSFIHICSHTLRKTTARFSAHGLEIYTQDASLSIAAQDTRSVEVYFGLDHTTLHYQAAPPSSYRLLHLLAKLNIGTDTPPGGTVPLSIRFGPISPMVMMHLTQLFQHMVPTPVTVTFLTSDRTLELSEIEEEKTEQRKPSAPPRQPDPNHSVVVDDSALPSFAKAKAIFEQQPKIITPMFKAQPYRKKKARCLSEGGITLGEPDNREMVLESKRRSSEDHGKMQKLDPELKSSEIVVKEIGIRGEKIDHGKAEHEVENHEYNNEHKDTAVIEGETRETSAQDNKTETLTNPLEMKETVTSQAKVVLLEKNTTDTLHQNKDLQQVKVQISELERKKADSLVKAVLTHKRGEDSTTTTSTDDSGVSSTNMSDRTPGTPSMESSKKHESKDAWSIEKKNDPQTNSKAVIEHSRNIRVKEEGVTKGNKESSGVRNVVNFSVQDAQNISANPERGNSHNSTTTHAKVFIISPEEDEEEEEETPSAILSSALKTVQEHHPSYRKGMGEDIEKQNQGKECKILKPNKPLTPRIRSDMANFDSVDAHDHQNVHENQPSNQCSNRLETEKQVSSNAPSNQNDFNIVDTHAVKSSETYQEQRLASERPVKGERNDLPQRQSSKDANKGEDIVTSKQSSIEPVIHAKPSESVSTKYEYQSLARNMSASNTPKENRNTRGPDNSEKTAQINYDGPYKKLISDFAQLSPAQEKAAGSPIMCIPATDAPMRIVRLPPPSRSPALINPTLDAANLDKADRKLPAPCATEEGDAREKAILEKTAERTALDAPQVKPCSGNAALDTPTLDARTLKAPSQLAACLGNATLENATLDAQPQPAACSRSATLDARDLNAPTQPAACSGNTNLDTPTLDASGLDMSALDAMPASSCNALKALTKLFTDAQVMQTEAMKILQDTVMQNYNQVQKLRDELKAEKARRYQIEKMLLEMQVKQEPR